MCIDEVLLFRHHHEEHFKNVILLMHTLPPSVPLKANLLVHSFSSLRLCVLLLSWWTNYITNNKLRINWRVGFGNEYLKTFLAPKPISSSAVIQRSRVGMGQLNYTSLEEADCYSIWNSNEFMAFNPVEI